MELHPQEMQLLAALTNDPAYILLTSKIEYLIQVLTEELHHADDVTTKTLLPYWRAMRTVYTELVLTPTSMSRLLLEHGIDPDDAKNAPKVTNELANTYRHMAEAGEDFYNR